MKKILTFVLALMATTCLVHSAEKDVKTNSYVERVLVVTNCAVTPMRQDPSERSEQVTQLLFGEVCEMLERQSGWAKIRSTMDGQEGWVSFKMVTPVGDEVMEYNVTGVVAKPMAVVTAMETGERHMLTIGTRLPNYSNGTFEVVGQQYQIDPNYVYELEAIRRLDKKAKSEDIVRVAKSLINVPYLWGGKNMMGYDCSGFTQVVYSVFGINILRNAREQITQGEVVSSLAEAQPGDLVFFDHSDRNPKATNISHVGMLISPTEVIHCSGCVHIDKIEDMGIRLANGELTHHLVQIKRYF